MTPPAPPSDIAVAATHFSAGRLDEAERICAAILASDSRHFDALQLAGIIRCQRGDLAGGLRLFDAALSVDPSSHDALANRGNALLSLGRIEQALESYDRALALHPASADLFNSRGNALLAMRRHGEALASFDAALALRPDHAGLLKNRGNALAESGRLEEALESYDRALRYKPDDVGALNNRGNVLRALSRLDEALACYDRALALAPRHVESLNNRGNALHALQRLDEAVANYEQALALAPAHADAHWNLALSLLAKNDLARGWQEYEWRWRAHGQAGPPPMPGAAWTGREDLRGKTILLHAEQGLGDTLQFCRYAPLVHERGARVILQVDRPLVRLLASLRGVESVVPLDEAAPRCDFQVPLLGLPLAFGTTAESIPAKVPYLFAQSRDVEAWSQRLGPRVAPRIGIAWSGNPGQAKDRNRSIPLAALEPLLTLSAQFISLQKEVRASDADVLARHPGLRHFGDELADFADTAALAQCCDLVIAVNSAVMHLAGAIGKPLRVPLGFIPDWRFVVGRDDCPWYPTARLYWQSTPGAWGDVVGRMVDALRRMVERGPRTGD